MYESSHEEAIRMEREVNENASEDIRQHSYILPFGFSISARAIRFRSKRIYSSRVHGRTIKASLEKVILQHMLS